VELQEDYGAISGLGAEILAISTDDLSQAQYAVDAIGLEFPILSDQDAMVIEEYGVLASGISRPATLSWTGTAPFDGNTSATARATVPPTGR
jgi:peroxiredoxin